LFDADGKQVLEVENTRLNSQGSQIALTTRFQTMEFANLYIAYETQVAEGGRVDSALTKSTEQADYTPDKHLLDSLNMGTAPESETDSESGAESATEPEEQQKGCKSLLAAPTALIALSLLALTSKKKKD